MPVQKVTREQIVETSTLVFQEKGYHKTSMGDLAEASGLLKGSLYHYFKSKEDLMIEVLDKFYNTFKKRAIEIIENDNLKSSQKLNKLINLSEEEYANNEHGSLMGNIVLECMNVVPEFVERIKQFFKEWIEMTSSVLQEWYKKDAAVKIAKDAIASIEGAVMMMTIFNDKTYLKRVHERLRRMVQAEIT